MIIGFTGRIAAGKETIKEFLVNKGFKYFQTSDILKGILIERGMEINRSNMQDLGDELRNKDGPGVLMKMFLENIDKNEDYIIDSLRNPKEAEFLRGSGIKFYLIAVDAPQKLRYERIKSRGKTSDPMIWEDFLKIDERDYGEDDENGQQVGKCMEIADIIIVNDGDIEKSMKEIESFWDSINPGK